MRSRKTPHGSIETGFAHAAAVIMATRSYREGKKMHWDGKREEILGSACAPRGSISRESLLLILDPGSSLVERRSLSA